MGGLSTGVGLADEIPTRLISAKRKVGPAHTGRMWDVWTRAELRHRGLSSRSIARAVESGDLIRVRKGHYVEGEAPTELIGAARIGGRVGCVSLLAMIGVFVFDDSTLHVHMERGDSRMRTMTGTGPLARRDERRNVALHWHRFREPPLSGTVDLLDALTHAVRCQQPRHAIATLDSVMNQGRLAPGMLDEVFAGLPERFRALRPLVDSRAESGPETLVRLMVRAWGRNVELQVRIDGVGRVDLLVDGWLVIECDSRQFHSSWEQRRKDAERDLALAEQ